MEETNFTDENESRNRTVIRTSILGIIANILLAGSKALIGILSNSIAIILDAVNNLSDMLSSLVTIIGTKLGTKQPNRKHPFGYGRIEYLSAMIVAAIVLYAGITSAVESVKKIIHPEPAEYTTVSLVVIGIAIVVKLSLGLFVRAKGKKVKSNMLVASGVDAMFDAILSTSVFICAIIYIFTKVSLEAYVGIIISGFIIKSGMELLMETVDDILGKRSDADTVKKVKALISEEEDVRGAYDLIINNYGPNKNYASVHIEIPDTMTADRLDALTRKLEAKVFKNTGIVLAAVGVYSFNTKNDEAAKIKDRVTEIVKANDFAVQMHGFYADTEKKTMRMDVVMSFNIKYREGCRIIAEQIKNEFPEYSINITPDIDISDI